jgi:phosphoribosyl 1,2-cyclic phosphate phosphodiesterase
MKITFLGTGTSTGVPRIGCDCPVCTSQNSRNRRLRSSVLLTENNEHILIDCGPDFREQMLREKAKSIKAILLTHEHYDHVAGLDDVRPLGQTNIYAEQRVLDAIQHNMPYSFAEKKYKGVPEFSLHEITDAPFSIDEWRFQPILLKHQFLPVFGYRIGAFAYLTDFNHIEETEFDKLKNLDILVIDALRITPHPSHNSLEEALAFASKINAKTTYLTHICHAMGLYEEVEKTLPAGVRLAYDGLELTV